MSKLMSEQVSKGGLASTGANFWEITLPTAPIYNEKFYPHQGRTNPKSGTPAKTGEFHSDGSNGPSTDAARDLLGVMNSTSKVDSRLWSRTNAPDLSTLTNWMRSRDPTWTAKYFIITKFVGYHGGGGFDLWVTTEQEKDVPGRGSSYEEYLKDYQAWLGIMMGSKLDPSLSLRENLSSSSRAAKDRKKAARKIRRAAAPPPTVADPTSASSKAKVERKEKKAEAKAKADTIRKDQDVERKRLAVVKATASKKHEAQIAELGATKRLQEAENSVAKVVAKRAAYIRKADPSLATELKIEDGWTLVTSKRKNKEVETVRSGTKGGRSFSSTIKKKVNFS